MTILTDVSTAALKAGAPGADAAGARRMVATSRAGSPIAGDALPSWRLARGDLHPETPCGMIRERVVPAWFPANPDWRRETERPACPWRTTSHVEPTRGPGGSGSGFS